MVRDRPFRSAVCPDPDLGKQRGSRILSIVPVVGGALGGLISGIIAVLNLLIVKGVKPIWLKILISIGMLAAAFLLCFLIGSMIVNALTQ